MSLHSIRILIDYFWEVEAENQDLFARLKELAVGALIGGSTIVAMLYAVGWEHAAALKNYAFYIIALFVALTCYRFWEAIKFEFTWPGSE